jgi:hypothetical protein
MTSNSKSLHWFEKSGSETKVILNISRALQLMDDAGDIKTAEQKAAYALFKEEYEIGQEPELKSSEAFDQRHIDQHRPSIVNALLIAGAGEELVEVFEPPSLSAYTN